MTAALIVFGVITLTLLIIGAYAKDRDTKFGFVVWGVGIMAMLVYLAISFTKEFYNNGQIDALKGTQTHEIRYVFPQGDTIPCDTLYVKIK